MMLNIDDNPGYRWAQCKHCWSQALRPEDTSKREHAPSIRHRAQVKHTSFKNPFNFQIFPIQCIQMPTNFFKISLNQIIRQILYTHRMFKKNPNRPNIVINLKKVSTGFKVISNQAFNPFSFKRITRAIFRSDLYHANSHQDNNAVGMGANSAMAQQPNHVTMPLSAQWFDLDAIHNIQREAFPEFFLQEDKEGSLFEKSPRLYRFYRNFIINLWRENSKKYLSPSVCRRNLPGDVSCIIRIHAFLENWGLINFPSKEHSKGYLAQQSLKYSCLICQQKNASKYYIAELEPEVIFQICNCCFKARIFPDFLKEDEFRSVETSANEKLRKKTMTPDEIAKMLEIINTDNSREKEIWASLAKTFPQYTREEIILNFMKIPANHKMNANIFSNNEDFVNDEEPPEEEEPTIFQDYQNPQLTAIAMAYYQWRLNPESDDLQKLFQASKKQAEHLKQLQVQKSNEMIRMLTDVQQSKLALKTIFLQQLQKLVKAEENHNNIICANTIAEALKYQHVMDSRNLQ